MAQAIAALTRPAQIASVRPGVPDPRTSQPREQRGMTMAADVSRTSEPMSNNKKQVIIAAIAAGVGTRSGPLCRDNLV
jgi:hypothetical protein